MADVGVPAGNPASTTNADTITSVDGYARQILTLGPRSGANTTVIPESLTPGAAALQTGHRIGNPSSVLTRPANTTAYAPGQLIASSTTAGSIVVPSFAATPGAQGAGSIRRFRLYTNKNAGMDAVTLAVGLWTAAPTFTNGDGGAYAVATGAAGWIGSFGGSLVQVGDGAYLIAGPDVGQSIDFVLSSGQLIYWTMQTSTAFTPASAQTFTLVPEITQY